MSTQITSFRHAGASVLVAFAPLVIAVTASLAAFGPAAAIQHVQENKDGVEALAVDFRDLHLSDPKDAQVLIGRLHGASDLVCRAEAPASSMSLSAAHTYRVCIRAAMDRAVRAVGDPAVTALYANELQDQAQLR